MKGRDHKKAKAAKTVKGKGPGKETRHQALIRLGKKADGFKAWISSMDSKAAGKGKKPGYPPGWFEDDGQGTP